MKTNYTPENSVSLRNLLVIPIAILTLTLFSLNASAQKSETGMTDGAYQKVDVMPEFPGGNAALLKYIAETTVYPKEAKEKGIQGKVLTRFMVKKDGSVSDVSILQGVNPALDNEAIRVVKTLPKFTPGKLNGKTVPVWFVIPISYALN
jgi:periplasmic protein TonB